MCWTQTQSRLNRGWAMFPLRSKKMSGKRGAGPESKAEAQPMGTVLAADGSPAFQSNN